MTQHDRKEIDRECESAYKRKAERARPNHELHTSIDGSLNKNKNCVCVVYATYFATCILS